MSQLVAPSRALAAVCAASLAAMLSGCNKPGGQHPGQMPPPEVNVVTVRPRDLAVTVEYVGQTAGIREVEVRPRVTGILEHWNYREGGPVRAGESLFTIDPAPFQAAVARADAQLASAQARLAQAERNVARLKPLYQAKATSQREYDDAVSVEQIAAADVKAAQAQLTQTRLDLQYTRVEAPISGISGRALKSEGSLVDAQQTLLTTITQIDPLYVIFSFAEAEHLKFARAVADGRLVLPKDGRFDVKLKLADGSEYARTGKVDFTGVLVNPSTGTIDQRAVIGNPQQLLRPGQFVRVQLSGAIRPGAISIPQRAVLEGPKGKIVLTVNAQGVVEPRPIEVGDWAGEDWIIDSGLKPGDRVIVDGMVKARPGSPVKVVDAAVPGPPPGNAQPNAETPAPANASSPGAAQAKPKSGAADAGKPHRPAR